MALRETGWHGINRICKRFWLYHRVIAHLWNKKKTMTTGYEYMNIYKHTRTYRYRRGQIKGIHSLNYIGKIREISWCLDRASLRLSLFLFLKYLEDLGQKLTKTKRIELVFSSPHCLISKSESRVWLSYSSSVFKLTCFSLGLRFICFHGDYWRQTLKSLTSSIFSILSLYFKQNNHDFLNKVPTKFSVVLKVKKKK